MNYLRRFVFVLLTLVVCFSINLSYADECFNGWTHLELGAGNYGADGHTKAALAMTFLLQMEYISDEKNFIDDLEEFGRDDYKPEDQYRILFWTLDQLVDRYGDVGVFHVNDLYEDYAFFAAQKLREYASSKGYESILVETISGDYRLIDPQKNLLNYGKTKYSTVHLKNPESSFYYNQMHGDTFITDEQYRKQTRLMLQNFADFSDSGLYLFIIDHDDFIPTEEKVEFIDNNIFYQKTSDWEPVSYVFPEGLIIEEYLGAVFYIKPD